MLNIISKYFFIILGCIFVSQKLINLEIKNFFQVSSTIIFSFFLTSVVYFSNLYLCGFINIIAILLIWIVIGFLSSNPQLSFILVIISYGFSYGFFLASSSVLLIGYTLFQNSTMFEPSFVFITFTGCLEIILISLLFKIKRFQHGMPFLYSKKFINIGTSICLFFLGILTYIQTTNNTQLVFYIFTSALLAISLAALIFWWQAQLTKSYLRKLQLLELESLRKELEETSREIKHLKKQNEAFDILYLPM